MDIALPVADRHDSSMLRDSFLHPLQSFNPTVALLVLNRGVLAFPFSLPIITFSCPDLLSEQSEWQPRWRDS